MYRTEHWSKYQDAIRSNDRPYDTVYGTITFTDGTTMNVNSSNMPSNSISVSKECIESGELMFGGVFLGTLKLSLITDKSRYAFYGAKVDLTYKIKVDTDTSGETPVDIYDEVPFGTHTVSSADRPTDRVNITAYDNLKLLDKEIGDVYITGTPWEVLSYVSSMTGIVLGFTQNDLTSFPNYNYPMQASKEQNIQTYRGVVKIVCQLMGCFAYADRDGHLCVKKFSTQPDTTLSFSDWYSCVPADYQCNYIAISVTGMKGTYTRATSDITAIGNIMVIEDAPAWDFGADDDLQARTDNLYAYLSTIIYTPADISMPSDPTFDCGDMVHLITRKGSPVNMLITSYEWKFHQGMTLTSEGINPFLEGNTALATESQRILSQAIEKSRLQFVSFTNTKAVEVGDNQTAKIGEVTFSPTTDTSALFVATVLVDVAVDDEEETEEVEVPVKAYTAQGVETVVTDLQGNPLSLTGLANNTYIRDGKCDVSIYYTLNDIKIPSNETPYVAVERLESGRHVITLSYPLIGLTAYQTANFEIFITSSGGTVSVPVQTLQATILGQEITPLNGFTGKISAEDEITINPIGILGLVSMIEDVTVDMTDAVTKSASDTLVLYNMPSISVKTLQESNVQIFMETGRLLLEDGAYLLLESGGKVILEDR